MKLSEEQIAYLKSLDSKKKRRKFMLDCLVENVIGESEKIEIGNFKDIRMYILPKKHKEFLEFANSDTTAPRTFEGIFGRMSNIKEEKDGSINFDLPSYNETKDEFDKKCDELLKFDMLEDRKRNYPISEIIDFVVNESLKKIDESDNCEKEQPSIAKQVYDVIYPEKKYTEEDMRQCFINSRLCRAWEEKNIPVFTDFEQYLNSLKND